MKIMRSAPEAAELALRMVYEAPVITYDTETSGVDWQRNYPTGYVVCADPRTSVWVPIRQGGGGNLPDRHVKAPESPTDPIILHPFERKLAEAFEYRRAQKGWRTVGHHTKFDCHFSANAEIYLGRNLVCTQNNEALLDEYARSYSLDSCAERHGVTAKKGQVLYDRIAQLFGCPATKKSMEHFWRLSGDDPVAVDYAEGDGVSTLELFESQYAKIQEQDLTVVFELESELIWTLFRMERRGIKVDEEYLPVLLKTIEDKVAEAFTKLPPDFNVRSPIQMRQYIESAGRTDWPTTEKGNPSFTEKWLKTFDEGRNVVTVRKWTNLANSFARPLLEEHTFKGRVHANINQLKADDSGTPARLSCSRPNLQQVPKRDKELAKMIRTAFVADPGMKFYEVDYSQAEPRLFSHYSKEQSLINGYTQSPMRDMHAVVAEMLSVERDPTAKRMNMGLLTGMYPKTFAMHMGTSLAEATEMWNAWFAAFPGIKDFQDLAKNIILERGFVKTLLKRRGRLEANKYAYRAVSKIIQGGNADIIKYKMLEIDKKIEAEWDDAVHLLMSVHDALEWQAPDTPEGDRMSQEMIAIMIDVQGPPFKLRVPFAVDAGSGYTWKEATFGAK